MVHRLMNAIGRATVDYCRRAVVSHFERKPDQPNVWLKKLLVRRNKTIAAVALAAT